MRVELGIASLALLCSFAPCAFAAQEPEPSEGPDLWGAVLSFLQYGYVAVVMGLFAYFMVVIERQNEIMESMKSRIAILEVQCRHAT